MSPLWCRLSTCSPVRSLKGRTTIHNPLWCRLSACPSARSLKGRTTTLDYFAGLTGVFPGAGFRSGAGVAFSSFASTVPAVIV
jgi:hypothetical protein